MTKRLLCLLAVLAGFGLAPAAGAFPNGQAGPGDTAPIFHPQHGVVLAKPAAAGWNTMRYCAVTVLGRDLYPGGANSALRRLGRPGDLRRNAYGSQWYFWELYRAGRGNLAARPGTSNHGLGTAIDLAQPDMRAHIDAVGRKYGWRKVEAFSEWWHVNYVGGFSGPDPGTSQRYPVLSKGSGFSCLSDAVKEAERRLGLAQDGKLERSDVRQVRAFQKRKGLKADGVVGPKTWVALRGETRKDGPGEIVKPPTETDKPAVGVDVRAAQGLLNDRFRDAGSSTRVEVDGVYGAKTEAAVREFQAMRSLEVDGRLGPKTWAALRVPARAPPFGAKTLMRAMPGLSAEKASLYAPHLVRAMVEAKITKLRRAQYFLAQLGHESASLRYFEEIASGAQYEGRRDLGNTQPGDGRRYKGRGPIQLTGRSNYRAAGKALGLNLESRPKLAAAPKVGFRVAGWYWVSRDLNTWADRGNFREVTRRINGGYNGYADRHARLHAIERLGEAVLPKRPKPTPAAHPE